MDRRDFEDWLDRFADPRHQQRLASPRAGRIQRFGRLVPGVHRQAEGAPVHRQERRAAEQVERLERVVRAEVDVAPSRVERADFEHHQVEAAEALADARVFAGQPGIAAEEHAMPRRLDDQ